MSYSKDMMFGNQDSGTVVGYTYSIVVTQTRQPRPGTLTRV